MPQWVSTVRTKALHLEVQYFPSCSWPCLPPQRADDCQEPGWRLERLMLVSRLAKLSTSILFIISINGFIDRSSQTWLFSTTSLSHTDICSVVPVVQSKSAETTVMLKSNSRTVNSVTPTVIAVRGKNHQSWTAMFIIHHHGSQGPWLAGEISSSHWSKPRNWGHTKNVSLKWNVLSDRSFSTIGNLFVMEKTFNCSTL